MSAATEPPVAESCPSFSGMFHPTEPEFAFLGFPPLPSEPRGRRLRAWWKELALRYMRQGTCCPGCRVRPGQLHHTPGCSNNYSQRADGRWA